jgi:dihydrofolate synthase/folylpolyglutamate synthase
LFNSLPVWERAGAGAYKPGLERIAAFASAVDMRPTKTIHVAGTNGKGSVSHMLAAVLQKAGYRTGLFTSPHLVDVRERIRVDGEMIPEAAVVEFTERYRDEMVRAELTFFEMATAMGLWWFSRAECCIAVIEAGLGGRLDSTNIITPEVSVITNIALEHTQYLGDTIAKIAAEKAGIIKPGIPVVVGETDPESAPVIRAKAAAVGSEITFADQDRFQSSFFASRTSFAPRQSVQALLLSAGRRFNFQSDLQGDYQQNNLVTVLATIGVLRRTLTIPDAAVQKGLRHAAAITGLRGRWQIVGRDPLVVLDTAHNAHGIARVVRQIARQPREKLYMVLGFAADKDLDAILPLLPADAHYILTQADTPRAMPAEELAERFIFNFQFSITNSVPEAIQKAKELATEKDMIFIGGSNFVVGEAIAALQS